MSEADQVPCVTPTGAPGGCDWCSGARGQTCSDRPRWYATTETTGMVSQTLGANGTPECINPQGMVQDCSTLNNVWFQDVPGVNIRFEQNFTLSTVGDNFEFQSSAFFPLEGLGWGDPAILSPPDMNCNALVVGGVCTGNEYNYFFTTEIHAVFVYSSAGRNGGQYYFEFEGDDDVWAFIDNKLVMDLGGVHPERQGTVYLNGRGLIEGQLYTVDVFHAERQITDSNFKLKTNIPFGDTCPQGTVRSCWTADDQDCDGIPDQQQSTSAQSLYEAPKAKQPLMSSATSSAATTATATTVPMSSGGSVSSVTVGAVVTLLALGLYKGRRLHHSAERVATADPEPPSAAYDVDVIDVADAADAVDAADAAGVADIIALHRKGEVRTGAATTKGMVAGISVVNV